MMRVMLFLLVALPGSALAVAQEFPTPNSLVDFLQPGMKLGTRSSEGSGDIHITIFSENAFAVESDGRLLELDALVEKYPEVAAAKEDALNAGPKSYIDERGRLIELGEPSIEGLLFDRRQLLCTVSHVGSDYILVTQDESHYHEDDQSRRKVYAVDRISTIVWRERPRLALSYRPVDQDSDRTNRGR